MSGNGSTERGPPEGSSGFFTRGRLLLLAAVALAVAAFFLLGLQDYLSLETVRARKDELKATADEHYLLSVTVFFIVYVVVCALSLPGGATVLSLVAGFLFGRWLGTGVVSFASTAGATLAFLSSRYLFRDAVQRRFGKWLEPIHRGVEREGAYYLLTLRLVPAFPFWVVNLAMGLTRLPVRTYWWVSQVGMLPATFLYVSAGTSLSEFRMSWELFGSLALLGVAPLVIKKAVQWWRKR